MQERVSSIVKSLSDHEVFVFGSNESGRHGKGAAKQALAWGARYGIGEGLSGNTYAIPTKNSKIQTLSKSKIKKYIENFTVFAKENPTLHFLVTEVGCGLAGYKPEDIAPFFNDVTDLENVFLPRSFWKVLGKY